MLYPYSTQATNRLNCHKLIFFVFGGGGGGGRFVRLHYFFFSNLDELRVSPDSDTMLLRIFRGIGSIPLESRKNSLRLENNIRTCCTKVKESITNQLRICRMQHEQGTNSQKSVTIREIFSYDSYKKGPYMLRGISSKMNFPPNTPIPHRP